MTGGAVRRALALGVAATAAAALAGCTPTVALTPAPDATSVGCAGVVVRLPQQIGVLDRRDTDAQGTGAWGDPAAVTLRCGVDEPVDGVCFTYSGIDWLSRDERIGGVERRVLDTYGRDPVVELVITPEQGGSANDAVEALTSDVVAPATSATGQRCRTSADLPTASPTPTPTSSPTGSGAAA